MRVIFLDIDGVLNGLEWLSTFKEREWDRLIHPGKVEMLNDIVRLSGGALVVISSSWNIAHPLPTLARILEKHGFKGFVIGATPCIGERHKEIQAWLDAVGRDVTSYVVLDDGYIEEHKNHLVKTSLAIGLEDHHVGEAVRILTRETQQ